MGKKIRLTLLLVVVFIVGAVAGVLGSSFLWHRGVLAPLIGNSLIDAATGARLISIGDIDRLLEFRVKQLPSLILTYNEYSKYLPEDDSRYSPLWRAQMYYEVSGDEVPAEIKIIFDSIPPRPPMTCKEKCLAETESEIEKKPVRESD